MQIRQSIFKRTNVQILQLSGQDSETSNTSHAFLPLTVAWLSTLRNRPFFGPPCTSQSHLRTLLKHEKGFRSPRQRKIWESTPRACARRSLSTVGGTHSGQSTPHYCPPLIHLHSPPSPERCKVSQQVWNRVMN